MLTNAYVNKTFSWCFFLHFFYLQLSYLKNCFTFNKKIVTSDKIMVFYHTSRAFTVLESLKHSPMRTRMRMHVWFILLSIIIHLISIYVSQFLASREGRRDGGMNGSRTHDHPNKPLSIYLSIYFSMYHNSF